MVFSHLSESFYFHEGRYERKFILDHSSLLQFELLVKLHPFLFTETYSQRNVNNIYFDSLDFSSYTDNLAGLSKRVKVRIRWYGDFFGEITSPVLELKIKNQDVGYKLSFTLVPFTLTRQSHLSFFADVFERSHLPPWVLSGLKHFHLSLLNSYKRKYFVSFDKHFRLTLDSALCYYHVGVKGSFIIHTHMIRDSYILELKYDQQYDSDAQRITSFFPFRFSRSSKYILGLDNF